MEETERYVECAECGHPIEQTGADGECVAVPGCPCPIRWSTAAIKAARQRVGLPARYSLSDLT